MVAELSLVDFSLDLADLLLQLVCLALNFAYLSFDLYRTFEMEVEELVQALLKIPVKAEERHCVVGLGLARLENWD